MAVMINSKTTVFYAGQFGLRYDIFLKLNTVFFLEYQGNKNYQFGIFKLAAAPVFLSTLIVR